MALYVCKSVCNTHSSAILQQYSTTSQWHILSGRSRFFILFFFILFEPFPNLGYQLRCPKSRFPIGIILFDDFELILYVSQGLTLSIASLVMYQYYNSDILPFKETFSLSSPSPSIILSLTGVWGTERQHSTKQTYKLTKSFYFHVFIAVCKLSTIKGVLYFYEFTSMF